MAMRLVMRGVAAQPLLTPQASARPVLSWAARWKGSASPSKTDEADKKKSEPAPAAAAEAPPEATASEEKAKATPAAELPVNFEVSRDGWGRARGFALVVRREGFGFFL